MLVCPTISNSAILHHLLQSHTTLSVQRGRRVPPASLPNDRQIAFVKRPRRRTGTGGPPHAASRLFGGVPWNLSATTIHAGSVAACGMLTHARRRPYDRHTCTMTRISGYDSIVHANCSTCTSILQIQGCCSAGLGNLPNLWFRPQIGLRHESSHHHAIHLSVNVLTTFPVTPHSELL
ncbi:hypothetical protein BD413DRAFT_316660 [Trametes elegans]|nr:hypothetical protein BD413DRAFT_316660 [Trametes elegans]